MNNTIKQVYIYTKYYYLYYTNIVYIVEEELILIMNFGEGAVKLHLN